MSCCGNATTCRICAMAKPACYRCQRGSVPIRACGLPASGAMWQRQRSAPRAAAQSTAACGCGCVAVNAQQKRGSNISVQKFPKRRAYLLLRSRDNALCDAPRCACARAVCGRGGRIRDALVCRCRPHCKHGPHLYRSVSHNMYITVRWRLCGRPAHICVPPVHSRMPVRLCELL